MNSENGTAWTDKRSTRPKLWAGQLPLCYHMCILLTRSEQDLVINTHNHSFNLGVYFILFYHNTFNILIIVLIFRPCGFIVAMRGTLGCMFVGKLTLNRMTSDGGTTSPKDRKTSWMWCFLLALLTSLGSWRASLLSACLTSELDGFFSFRLH